MAAEIQADALYKQGRALVEAGLLDAAIAPLQRALLANSRLTPAHLDLGVVLARQRKLDRAVAHLRRAVELAPDDPNGYANPYVRHALVETRDPEPIDALLKMFRGADAEERQRYPLGANTGTQTFQRWGGCSRRRLVFYGGWKLTEAHLSDPDAKVREKRSVGSTDIIVVQPPRSSSGSLRWPEMPTGPFSKRPSPSFPPGRARVAPSICSSASATASARKAGSQDD